MTALEYMKRQAESGKRNLEMVGRKKGVTEQELNNIKAKISYYEEAARALEKVEPKAVVKSETYGSDRCPKCDNVIYRSQHYCSQCGQKFDWRI